MKRHALVESDLRLFCGRLHNHDYLWFSSQEISKLAATVPLLHNYALSYAVSGYSYGIYSGNTPRYAEDLSRMGAYATPARSNWDVASTSFTQNAINSCTLRTDDAPKGRNSPSFGRRLVLDPVWRKSSSAGGETGYGFYLFSRSEFQPPGVVRLGKKGCPIRLEWEELKLPEAVFSESAVRPTHAVNPLDVGGTLVSYQPIPIPPHLVFRTAEIRGDWFVFSGAHRVHLPSRFVPKAK